MILCVHHYERFVWIASLTKARDLCVTKEPSLPVTEKARRPSQTRQKRSDAQTPVETPMRGTADQKVKRMKGVQSN